ncbi:probable serine/threonine-protein kinase PBL5 isoform X2 [Lycium ferocissimum]|uniref:probable serine/threonine-protein kinase PBL5 isoform X2 n=1 Tax=Lycium ferocissimum TaxID=112874 RepID=UPI0028169251|nr:probable serine/threonine-protein kinase PBL5 isoform X2 [Lycium ferocissimum]
MIEYLIITSNRISHYYFKLFIFLVGQRNKVDQKLVEEELVKRMDEYNKSMEMLVLLKQCEVQKVKFHIEVQAGNSRKVVAVIAIKRLGATWIILDREMKKEKRYFMDKLSCGISKLKSDNSMEDVRGPLTLIKNAKVSLTRNRFSYDEMIPGDDDSSEELSSSQQNLKVVSHMRTSSKEQASSIPGKPGSDFCENLRNYSGFPSLNLNSSDLVNSSSSLGNQNSTSSSSHQKAKTTTENSPSDISNDQNQNHQNVKDKEKEEIFSDQYFYGVISKKSECSICENRRPKMRWHKDFSYKELEEATGGFSGENFLSEGGFGSVYKGVLKNELRVAVKQHKDMSLQGDKQFKSEVDVLSKARHPNLVMLLGSCSQGNQKLLVYEYVCNGSLDHFLSDIRMPLNWERRIKIALGAAKGLEYLHKHNIIHRDIRPNNILITHDYESLLGDFGLAKAGYDESQNSSGNSVVGTLGYMAPEYAASGKFSTKTDVYAFGVVLLQLITGLKTTDKYPEDKSLVEWAMPLLEQRNYPCLIDKRIMDSHDFHQLFWMVELAEKCLEKDPNKRQTMEWVVKTLSHIMEGNADYAIDFNSIESSSCVDLGNNDHNSKHEDGKGNEEDKILGTEATSSSSSKRWSPSSSNSTHEEYGRRKTPRKHKGPSPNKGKLLYKEMIID